MYRIEKKTFDTEEGLKVEYRNAIDFVAKNGAKVELFDILMKFGRDHKEAAALDIASAEIWYKIHITSSLEEKIDILSTVISILKNAGDENEEFLNLIGDNIDIKSEQ